MNTDETGIPARGHAPRLGTRLAVDATLLLVGGIVTTTIRIGNVPAGLTGMTETGPPGAWTTTLPRGTGMTIPGDGGTTESERRGLQQKGTAREKTRIRIETIVGRLRKTGTVVSGASLVGTGRMRT